MAQNIVISSELGQEFLIGTETANKITVSVDGTSITKPGGVLTATPGSMTYDPATTILTYTAADGTIQNINLSGLTTDIFVDGATYDSATMVLTLTDNDAATPDVTVDLSALLGVSTDVNNILTNGADGKPFLDCAAIETCATETCESVFGTQLFKAFPA